MERRKSRPLHVLVLRFLCKKKKLFDFSFGNIAHQNPLETCVVRACLRSEIAEKLHEWEWFGEADYLLSAFAFLTGGEVTVSGMPLLTR